MSNDSFYVSFPRESADVVGLMHDIMEDVIQDGEIIGCSIGEVIIIDGVRYHNLNKFYELVRIKISNSSLLDDLLGMFDYTSTYVEVFPTSRLVTA